jgi:membrane protein DedA with SNARE-associated domain
VEEFLKHYGLMAVYFGMWLEGETVLVIAGFLAHEGLFPLWLAYPTTVLGAVSVDHIVYLCGRFAGRSQFVDRLHVNEEGARTWTQRMGDSWWAFFALRFVYGTRMAFVFYCGHKGMHWVRFIARELPAVLFWCAAWLFFGGLLSHVLSLALGGIHHHLRGVVVACLALVGTGILILLGIRKRRRGLPNPSPSDPSREEEKVAKLD